METMEKQIEEKDLATVEDEKIQRPEVREATAGGEVEAGKRSYMPAVDLLETEQEVTLIVDVPGVNESGVNLAIEKNILSLTAMPASCEIPSKRLAYSEYGVGEYKRSFALSEEVDRDHVTASLKNGVMKIVLPKMAPVTKKINLTTT